MSFLSMPEVHKHLNITGTVDDDELQDFIDAAESAISTRCGPIEPTSQQERHAGGGATSLLLRVTPVVSVESVTAVNGAAVDVSQLTWRDDTGVLIFTRGMVFPARLYDVTYTAGWESLPSDLLLAVKELVRHFWEGSQRGPTSRPGRGSSAQKSAPGISTGLPDAVAELIDPYIPVAIA